MTLKEAILKSLEDLNKPVSYMEIYTHISDKAYIDFSNSKTPYLSVSGVLTSFIQKGDTRVKRIKESNGAYAYYLTKNEQEIDVDVFDSKTEQKQTKNAEKNKKIRYSERDLHILLSSYLKNASIFSKTIFHEQSNNKDSNQIWTHPDMVGVKFLNLRNATNQSFIKAVNKLDTLKLYSYELKREINTDNDLKKSYFQAVSNSSWANYGYLVAFEISNNLHEEMARLNQSFGIGIIELNANPFRSKVLFPAEYKELNFNTIDKLCNLNLEFEQFVAHVENLITTEQRNYDLVKNALNKFCDTFLQTDEELTTYCKEKHIPIEEDDDEN